MAGSDSRPALKLETGQSSSQDMPPPSASVIATPSTDHPRPILKLSTSRRASLSGDPGTPAAEKKIRIRVNTSQPSTPAVAVAPVTKTKAGRSSRPTEKVIEAKKRQYESDDDDEENAPLASRKVQKIKMRPPPPEKEKRKGFVITPTAGKVYLKPKGERVPHIPGDAWDSEASDREDDPVRECAMILRTIPGPSTDYLNKAIEEGRIGQPKSGGNGADLAIEWLDAKERRAMVTVDGIHYAAVLVDLPTIIEAMKTWDRKNFLKNTDICQMLLCFAEVKNEHEARSIAIPQMVRQNEFKWPHGITPPMHDAANRRFRKQPSEKQLVTAAAQVRKLLADDALAIEPPTFDFVQDEEDGFIESGDEDAEGEEEVDDYFGDQANTQPLEDEDEINADLEADLEAVLAGNLEDDLEMESEALATQLDAQTPMTLEATTPAAALGDGSDVEPEEEEEISDEDEDDDDDDEDLDEEEAQRQAEFREIKSEMLDLQKKVESLEAQLASNTNALMRNRLQANIRNFKQEIQLRKAKLNITDDE